jgi:hypothetical protein
MMETENIYSTSKGRSSRFIYSQAETYEEQNVPPSGRFGASGSKIQKWSFELE